MGTEMKGPKDRERIESVLKILKKQAPVTVKQPGRLWYCVTFDDTIFFFFNLQMQYFADSLDPSLQVFRLRQDYPKTHTQKS
ncbi:hypothetical protein B296_00035768 [Ensete ventricosum]|uniref:Uncharacterized protein n=1 Tax=Ensete ventricosum TaxID=4639 RepID=A0A426Y830_ENSVE|nr:hypothetical protein B296_00035768 [Ensete ventricosum]